MSQAYTPGLKVSPREHHVCRRLLPIPGEVRVQVGQTVDARDVIAETFMPGAVTPLNLANQLSVPPGDVAECMLKGEGEAVDAGEVLARSPGIFGFFQTEFRAPVGGSVESISDVTGQVILRGAPVPVQVRAYLSGRVVDVMPREGVVIESEVSLVQGIFGIGGEAFGPVQLACEDPSRDLTPELLRPDMRGAVVVGGARLVGAAVHRAIELGVAALVCGGMDDEDLRDILGYDLGVAVTGSERLGITLVITEGFGDIAMAEQTWKLLAARAGAEAAVSGTTQIRAGVVRPEVIIPRGAEAPTAARQSPRVVAQMAVGTPVRVIRDPYFGRLATVVALPAELRQLASESWARVVEIEFAPGERAVVPRANVEIMAE
jgi:hypothetical protein